MKSILKPMYRFLLIASVLIAFYAAILLANWKPWMVIFWAVVWVVVVAKRQYTRLTTLGSARWADADDLRRAGMLDATSGLILGRITDSRRRFWPALKALFDPRVASDVACEKFLQLFRKKPAEHLVRLPNAVHTAVFAPTGVGKGVSCIVPFLKSCSESCVVLDPKGENAKLTGDYRREVFGHRVVILDPFREVTQNPDRFNPLDCIKKSSSLAIDDCRDAAAELVVTTGEEKDPHWPQSAEAWIAGMLAVTAYYGEPGDRSLQTVRTLLSNPAKLDAVLKLMCSSDEPWGGMLARMGHELTHYKGDEFASVRTTMNRFMRFLDTLAVAENTKSSTFDPSDLCKGKMTIYLVLPPDRIPSQTSLLRLWIGSLLRAVVRNGLQEKNKVHFVLDEAASLGGKMQCLESAVDKYRGYGVRLQFYLQSLGQLQKFGKEGQDQTLLSNTTQVFFGVSDPSTARYVVSRLDKETVWVAGGGGNTGWSQQFDARGGVSNTSSGGESWDRKQNARELLTAGEVMTLPQDVAITFTPGVPPLCTKLIKYYQEDLAAQPSVFRRAVKTMWTGIECVTLLLSAILMTAVVTQLLK